MKSANVLLSNDNSVRLGDFGLSRLINTSKKRPFIPHRQTTHYNVVNHHPDHHRVVPTSTLSKIPSVVQNHQRKKFVMQSKRSLHTTEHNTELAMSQAGTDCYMAPEILKEEDYGKPVR